MKIKNTKTPSNPTNPTQAKMQFSRYLYEKSEIQASFINTILKKQRNEATFWITELFLSGWREETVDLLWQVYYDFYYIYYSNLERKLSTLLREPPTLKSILTATTTLLSLKQTTTHVFEIRLIIEKTHVPNVNYIYKRIPKHYDNYKNKRFILSIKREHIVNIAYYFQKIAQSPSVFADIQDDIKTLLKLSKFSVQHKNESRKKHMLIAMISKHMILHKKKSIKITKVALSPIESSILEEIAREEKSVETQNPYRVLSSQRKYGIDNDVGLDHFSLQRFQKETTETTKSKRCENPVQHNIYFHWEYYAFHTPVWRERFERYKAFQNHETKEVEFPTEEIADQFYQKYAYDPDEQPTETDQKSTKKIEEITYDIWLSNINLQHI